MPLWITAIAAFYAIIVAYLAYEMWRAPLVNDAGRILEEGKTLHSAWHVFRLRVHGS
jgi:hypothetical protein